MRVWFMFSHWIQSVDFPLSSIYFGLVFQYWFNDGPLFIPLLELVGVPVVIILALSIPDAGSWLKRMGRSPFVMPWILLAVIAVAQWSVAKDWAYGINDVRHLALSVALATLFLSLPYCTPRRLMGYFLAAMLVSALAAQVIRWSDGLTPPFSHVLYKDLIDPLNNEGVRVPVGFFLNANVLAGFLFWPMLYLLPRLRLPKTVGDVWPIVLLLIFSFTLVMTLARGILLGIGLAVFLYLLIRNGISPAVLRWMLAAVFVSAIALMVILFFFPPTEGFFVSLGLRNVLWKATVAVLGENPCVLLLGNGACAAVYPDGFAALAREDPHNIYLYMINHYGLAGLLVMCLSMIYLIGRGWKRYRSSEKGGDQSWQALWAGWIAFPVMGVLDSYFNALEWRVLFFLMAVVFIRMTENVSGDGMDAGNTAPPD